MTVPHISDIGHNLVGDCRKNKKQINFRRGICTFLSFVWIFRAARFLVFIYGKIPDDGRFRCNRPRFCRDDENKGPEKRSLF